MIKRTERGWAGHFIGASQCRFHLNTLLEKGDKKVVISTVGCYIPKSENSPRPIGCDRFYETFACRTRCDEEFIEADICKQLAFKSQWCISEPFKDNEANEMHEKVVQEFIKKMSKAKKMEGK